MSKPLYLFIALACVWLGVSLGANLLAAPAKFTVLSIERADLIAVGRAQFTWVGRLEMGLAAALLISSAVSGGLSLPKTLLVSMALAITALLTQRFILHPALIQSPSGALHIAYVASEVAKAGLLAITAFIAAKV